MEMGEVDGDNSTSHEYTTQLTLASCCAYASPSLSSRLRCVCCMCERKYVCVCVCVCTYSCEVFDHSPPPS